MIHAPQSSPALRRLPASLALLCAMIAGASLLAGRPALRTGVLVTLGAVTAVAGAAFARKLWVA